jgi:hypothetical protein
VVGKCWVVEYSCHCGLTRRGRRKNLMMNKMVKPHKVDDKNKDVYHKGHFGIGIIDESREVRCFVESKVLRSSIWSFLLSCTTSFLCVDFGGIRVVARLSNFDFGPILVTSLAVNDDRYADDAYIACLFLAVINDAEEMSNIATAYCLMIVSN